ncbi:MAG TPA: M48 family metalloprotease, partial [Acidimicrobiales bacterium]|nr:M48 family metalloprotease [Acidimicrobiales bacterium]
GRVPFPVQMAAASLALILLGALLSPLNRPCEWRADREGAALCGEPVAMAAALASADQFIRQARRRLPPPWRWLVFPLSWRLPSHPSMRRRVARLEELAAAIRTGTPA